MSISKCIVRLKDCHNTEHSVEVYAVLGFGRGGGDRTRAPNYKGPWNEGVAAAHRIQFLILLIPDSADSKPKTLGVLLPDKLERSVSVESLSSSGS